MLPTKTTYETIALEGHIITNTYGINKLLEWYYSSCAFPNATVYCCCKQLEWIDANLAALWSALIYKLAKTQNTIIQLDEDSLSSRFSILMRNGFSQPNITGIGIQNSFIRNAKFFSTQYAEFANYITSEILQQQQIKNLPTELRSLLEQNLDELYENVVNHAGTSDPLFICGQYYSSKNQLVVSVVDLGQTFLPRIQLCTNGEVKTQQAAIDWALKGNSEMGDQGGGHALKCIKDYFDSKGHVLQILTGNAYWNSSFAKSLMGSHREMPRYFPGTMVSFVLNVGRLGKKS